MKILFLVRQLNLGGSERQLVILANELARRRHEIVVAAYYPGGALAKEVDGRRVRLASLGKRSRWDLIPCFRNLHELIRREQPDVLHGWALTPNLMVTMARVRNRRVKLFWCVRSSNLELIFDRVESLASWFECRLSRFADRIVVNSRAGLEHAVSCGFPREKMIHIPNGIDASLFYPDPAAGQQVRAEWGLDGSVKVIGLVGRSDPIKNHPVFLRACARLAAERNDLCFVAIGHDGPDAYLNKLQELSRKLGIGERVKWLPARADMRAVYNALDILCSSSLSEGFPNVIGEAMACGRRCVATDVGDSGLLVGDTGTVVPPDDPEALAQGLRQELGAGNTWNERGRRRILENFTVMHLGDRTEAALAFQSFPAGSPGFEPVLSAGRTGSAVPPPTPE